MRLEILGYELVWRKAPSGVRFVTEEELIGREKRVNAAMKELFKRQEAKRE